jgi:hypothetical protein
MDETLAELGVTSTSGVADKTSAAGGTGKVPLGISTETTSGADSSTSGEMDETMAAAGAGEVSVRVSTAATKGSVSSNSGAIDAVEAVGFSVGSDAFWR